MSKYETPEYEVVLKEKPFELRKYVDFQIVEYENSDDPDVDKGFGTLFKYISSDNKANEKIAMTVPVIKEETRDNQTMAFVVPRKYSDNTPEPNDPNLKVRTFDQGLFAAIQFSGRSNKSTEVKMSKKLEEWVAEKGYIKQSDFMLAFYNGPFTPPMFRRNEIWVRISKK